MSPEPGRLLWLVVAAMAAQRATAPQAAKNTSQETCGFESCNLKAGMVNVHIVPHSHDDVGWLKTVDQYYYGLNMSLDWANVSMILDSVFKELIKDPNKRFVQVETIYLWMWWQHQNDQVKKQYRQLVQTGRVQITGGGWSMPDEAITNYQSLIDNYSSAFKFLYEEFGACGIPNVGWQIDPFGHSRETASLMAAMGFQGVFLGRLDYQDSAKRSGDSTLEMVWHASDNLGPQADIFAGVLYGGYGPPSGCCWDLRCQVADIGNNAPQVATTFIAHMNSMLKHFKTRNLLITMGTDFAYMNATRYYKNLDKLIGLVNDRQKNGSHMNLLYSTPSCYLKAVNQAQVNLTTKSDDFLPYASEGYTLFTGFYSSRPTLKYFERLGNNFLQVCKQLSALARMKGSSLQPLDRLRRSMGILQHHDAITGTSRLLVAEDYAKTLSAAFDAARPLAQAAINTLLGAGQAADELLTTSCPLLNISQCDVSEENDDFIVTVYNPLSRAVSHYVRLPVKEGSFSVTSLDGTAQLVQMLPIPSPVLDLKIRRSAALQEVVFKAADLPPLGMRSYRVTRTSSVARQRRSRQVEDTFISNSHVTVKIDSVSGLVDSIISNGTEISVRHNFYYYESRFDDGAYAFKPRTSKPIVLERKATFTVYKGELVEEIHQIFNDWVSQVIRIYKDDYHAEFEWLVGPIPLELYGRHIVSEFLTNVQSNKTFYTDSNGREMQERILNYRRTFTVEMDEPVSANYYPVPTRIVVKDEDKGVEFAVLTDRSQGGTSLQHGQVELMVHRRTPTDDLLGLNEPLNDTQPARGKHIVICGESSGYGGISLPARQRLLVEKTLLQPWLFLAPSNKWPAGHVYQYSGLQKALPDNVHVLSLEPWVNNTVLLRLEHIMEKSDDDHLSQNVTVDIQELFSSLAVSKFTESTLDGTQWLSNLKRFTWKTADGSSGGSNAIPTISGSHVTLTPMQIRTFVLTIKNSW